MTVLLSPALERIRAARLLPNAPAALRDVLQAEQYSRDDLTPGDFKAHVAALHDGLIEQEARRIVERMKGLDNPNSPNKTHFMVELAPAFMQLANTKDTNHLFAMLPYKTLSFSTIKGRHGTYAMIGKDAEQGDTQAPLLYPGAACRRQENRCPQKGGGETEKT